MDTHTPPSRLPHRPAASHPQPLRAQLGRAAALFVAIAMLTLHVGCVATSPPSQPAQRSPTTTLPPRLPESNDASAQPAANPQDLVPAYLHEISGLILLYYAEHRRLPTDLAVLAARAGQPMLAVHPATARPWILHPTNPDNRRTPQVLISEHQDLSFPQWIVLIPAIASSSPSLTLNVTQITRPKP